MYKYTSIKEPLWIHKHPGAGRDGLALSQHCAGSHGHVLWGQFTAWQQLLLSSSGLSRLSSAPAVAPQGLGNPGGAPPACGDITLVPCTEDRDRHAAHGSSQPFTPSCFYPADLEKEGIKMFKAEEKAQNKVPAIPPLFTPC